MPDYLVGQLAKILHQGSQLYKFPFHTPRSGSPGLGDWSNVDSSRNSREEFEKMDLESVGSTATGEVVPRERFSYWCFDLLFLICSNVTSGTCYFSCYSRSDVLDWQIKRRRGGEWLRCVCRRCWIDARRPWWVISRMRRFAVVCLSRGDFATVHGVVQGHSLIVNGISLRVREDELLYVLRKLLELRVWPGTLWAALSDAPSANSASVPGALSYAETDLTCVVYDVQTSCRSRFTTIYTRRGCRETIVGCTFVLFLSDTV